VGPTISSLIGAAKVAMAQLRMHFSALSTLSCTDWRNGNWHDGISGKLSVTTLLHEAYLDIAAREGNRFPDRPRFMVMPRV